VPRVLLIGQGPTAATALESLVTRLEVVGVVRSTVVDRDPVLAIAATHGIPVYGDASVRAIEALVDTLQPQCVVVSSYDRILAPALLVRSQFVNVHYAALPKYRGRATVNWAVINGEADTAITIHELAPRLDAGAILFQKSVPIEADDTVATLYARLNAIQCQSLGPAVEAFLGGRAGRPQTEKDATYACTRLPDDGVIDWSASTTAIDALIRALVAPFPGAFTHLAGERLKVWAARPLVPAPRYVGRVPGRVVAVSKAQGWVDVLTGDGVLRVLEVQCEDGDRVAAATVIKSVKATLGLRPLDLLARIAQLEQQISQLRQELTHTVQG
jgi:methionyl-tRNA formyltransferase